MDPGERLRLILKRYVEICHQRRRHGADELAAALHRTESVTQLRHQLLDLITRVIADAASAGSVRDDLPPNELALFAVHALDTAGDLASVAARTRLLDQLVWPALAASSVRR
jgi:hypothetical protein